MAGMHESELVARTPDQFLPAFTLDEYRTGIACVHEELFNDFETVARGFYNAHFQDVPNTFAVSNWLGRMCYTIFKRDRRLFHEMAGTRPYMTLGLMWGSLADRDLWHNTRFKHFWDPCPVCLETKSNSERESPVDGIYGTRCSHYLCKTCWEELMRQEQVLCPVCRDDVSAWAHGYLANVRILL